MTSTFNLAGHEVKRVGFGAMQLPGPGVFGEPRDPEQAKAVLRRAIELGINHIDTSQFYGPDVANRLIREVLHPYPADLLLVSKVGGKRDDQANWLPAQTPAELRADVHKNLESLGVDRLPVVNLRVMPADEHSPEGYQPHPYEEQLQTMRELVDEGALEAFGVSTVTPEQARLGIEAGAVCVQNAYNLLHRDDEETLELTREKNIAYVPYFPLGSAFGWLPRVTEDARVQAVAQRKGITPSQVGLAWLLAHSPNILLIPGTSSLAHLEENTAAGDVELSADDIAELEAPRA